MISLTKNKIQKIGGSKFSFFSLFTFFPQTNKKQKPVEQPCFSNSNRKKILKKQMEQHWNININFQYKNFFFFFFFFFFLILFGKVPKNKQKKGYQNNFFKMSF